MQIDKAQRTKSAHRNIIQPDTIKEEGFNSGYADTIIRHTDKQNHYSNMQEYLNGYSLGASAAMTDIESTLDTTQQKAQQERRNAATKKDTTP